MGHIILLVYALLAMPWQQISLLVLMLMNAQQMTIHAFPIVSALTNLVDTLALVCQVE